MKTKIFFFIIIVFLINGCSAYKMNFSSLSEESENILYETNASSTYIELILPTKGFWTGKEEWMVEWDGDGKITRIIITPLAYSNDYYLFVKKNKSIIEKMMNLQLLNSQLFISDKINPEYRIDANFFGINSPEGALNFDTWIGISYDLIENNEIVWSKTIYSNGTSNFKEAFSGVKRSRYSFEKALFQNINLYLSSLNEFLTSD